MSNNEEIQRHLNIIEDHKKLIYQEERSKAANETDYNLGRLGRSQLILANEESDKKIEEYKQKIEEEQKKLRDLRGETEEITTEVDLVPSIQNDNIKCPYPGMAAFTAKQAQDGYFKGRENETAELIKRLRLSHLIFVIGPSGSGKSSLVSAGLPTELNKRQPNQWSVKITRPGKSPMQSLAAVLGTDFVAEKTTEQIENILRQNSPAQYLLIIIDQFEEIFTQADKSEANRFIDAIKKLSEVEKCKFIMTMRVDFYGSLSNTSIRPSTDGQRLEILPLRDKALRRAIQEPAKAVGVELEPQLLDQLIDDVKNEPGYMPMLQETMVLLWERRHGKTLSFKTYQGLGKEDRSGLTEAMRLRADATLEKLTPHEQEIARRIFIRLVHFGEENHYYRRQQRFEDLRSHCETETEFNSVLDKLTSNGLVTLGSDYKSQSVVDIAHEMLIIGWPISKEWVQKGYDVELKRRELVSATEDWKSHKQEGSYLTYRGKRLREARKWSSEHKCDLAEAQQEFLSTCTQRERRERLLLLPIGFTLIFVLFLGWRGVTWFVSRTTAINLQPTHSFDTKDSTLTAFSIDLTEISYQLYHLCVDAWACHYPALDATNFDNPQNDYLPIVGVNAYDAETFCRWIGRRLPTLEEWSYAAFGKPLRLWPWGDTTPELNQFHNYVRMGVEGPIPDGSVAVNSGEFDQGNGIDGGLHHMLGNVWEWTRTSVTQSPACTDMTICSERVQWDGNDTPPQSLYIAGLSWNLILYPDSDQNQQYGILETASLGTGLDIGFRCAGSS